MKKKALFLSITSLCVIMADQFTKHISSGQDGVLIPHTIRITNVQNTGIAMSMFSGASIPIVLLSFLITAAIAAVLLRSAKGKATLIAGGLIIGGSIGNIIDRLRFGYVIDFIDLMFVRFYIFNIADACITMGVVLIMILLVVGKDQWIKQEAGH